MEKKVKGETIFQGKIITVEKDKVLCENNIIATREVVRHNGGVGVLALVENKIILVRQFRYPYNEDTLEIPAGKLEKGEDPLSCGIRELEEETGYRTKSLTRFATIYPTPGYCDEVLHLYEATDFTLVEDPLASDEDEFIDVVYMDLDTAHKKVVEQEIRDSKTVIAINHAYIRYLEEKLKKTQ